LTIVAVHNWYRYPGGEDQVFRAECALLEDRGHAVKRFTEGNATISRIGTARLLCSTFWNQAAYRAVRELVERNRAPIAHFHNTFPLLSPSVLQAARDAGASVVQTLHNFRIVCPNGLLFRDGASCQECVGRKLAWPAVVHGCYRGSHAASAAAAMVSARRLAQAKRTEADAYIVLSNFARSIFIAGGMPENKLAVKPNFVDPDPGAGNGDGGYILYLGRLAEEKGLRILIAAWKKLKAGPPLKIIGDGPLAPWLQSETAGAGIECLGQLPHEEAIEALKRARLLVIPSLCYEGSPLAALEAFAAGVPVVVSRIGSLAELVEDGRNGLHARPGDPDALAAALDRALSTPRLLQQMRLEARREYESKYTASKNYEQLMQIYGQARDHG
jgi:glycosyltransferase involved in cell wall biosynthesis